MTQQNPQNPTLQQPVQQPAQQPQPPQIPQQPQQSPQPQPPLPNPQPMPQQPQPLISFAPEPQAPNAYDSIIAQQNEQIAALIAQNQALTGQITQMVQGGAQFTQQPQQPQQPQQMQQVQQPSPLAQLNPPSLSDNDDYSLEALAKEIGNRHP